MQTGVYSAQKKDGTVYYRANITYQTKHISLGSFSSEEDAHSAYLEACNLLENEAVTLFNIHSQIRHLSFDKADRKSTRLNSSHTDSSRMPSSA